MVIIVGIAIVALLALAGAAFYAMFSMIANGLTEIFSNSSK